MLVNKGAGVAIDSAPWPVYYGSEPSAPDDVLTVYQTTPISFGQRQFDGEEFLHYGALVRVRGSDYDSVWVKAEALRILLNEQITNDTVTIGGVSYVVQHTYRARVVPYGTDGTPDDRWLVNVNFMAVIVPR